MQQIRQAVELCLEGLFVSLSGKNILHGVDLQVAPGQMVSLLGPSGCGKSTLLKSVAGLIPTESGHVRIDGHVVDTLSPEKRGAVIVFQDLRLFPHLSVAGNIAFALGLQGVDKAAQANTVKHLLTSVRLEGMEHRKVWQLSGGQQQRVALARAIAAKPKILLLDEPFSGLDEALRAKMRTLVMELHKEYGMTTVLVTHDKSEAFYMSDRIALMLDGTIVQYDEPEQLYRYPVHKKAADYFGGCSYLGGTVKDGTFTCPLFSCTAQGQQDGAYLAMIRPAMLTVSAGDEWLVVDSRYLGDCRQLTVEKDGIRLTAQTAALHVPGNRVGIAFALGEIPLFPKNAS